MRIKTVLLAVTIIFTLTIGFGCTGTNPIAPDPNQPGTASLSFVHKIIARLNQSTGVVWIGAPQNTTVPFSFVLITIPGQFPEKIQSNSDGSFLFKFAGDQNSTATVEWTDLSLAQHTADISVTDPLDGFDPNIGIAGKYPNRMTVTDSTVWVVNSGDEQLASYDLDSLQPGSFIVNAHSRTNIWDAAFDSYTSGLMTTLFGGVFYFNAVSYPINSVKTDGFRDFASPNGVVIVDDIGWVVNSNPISWFPSEYGQGWISKIDLHPSLSVVDEINTDWFNPQYVISDGEYIYVSCSGTIDFVPPDYIATALDNGGVHVINPQTSQIIASYDLGRSGPGPMALSPDSRYLYIGSGVAGSVFRICLDNGTILNDLSDPIVISDMPGTFVPFLEVSESGLIACASFNTDTIQFIDSWTGEVNPFPFFDPIELHPDDPGAFYGPQDAAFVERNGEEGLLVLTTVESAFHWIGF